MKACYYCLSVDIEPNEKTGSGYDICPKCYIDSVTPFINWNNLYALHCTHFHFGVKMTVDQNQNQEDVLIVCGHEYCKKWDEIVKEIYKFDLDEI